jgi:hypothetical protein
MQGKFTATESCDVSPAMLLKIHFELLMIFRLVFLLADARLIHTDLCSHTPTLLGQAHVLPGLHSSVKALNLRRRYPGCQYTDFITGCYLQVLIQSATSATSHCDSAVSTAVCVSSCTQTVTAIRSAACRLICGWFVSHVICSIQTYVYSVLEQLMRIMVAKQTLLVPQWAAAVVLGSD